MNKTWKLVEKNDDGEVWKDYDGNLIAWIAGDDVWVPLDPTFGELEAELVEIVGDL